jgi:hypothetical protein
MKKLREGVFIFVFLGVFLLLFVVYPAKAEAAVTPQVVCQHVIENKRVAVGALTAVLNKAKPLDGGNVFCEATIVKVGRTDVVAYLVVFLYYVETNDYDSWEIANEVLPTFI